MTSEPLSQDDLREQWKSVTDESYHRPLLEQPDSGIEVIDQALAQMARVSLAVDRTTQSLYIFPWSGQSDEPATGGQRATVDLEFTRSAGIAFPIVWEPGIAVLHVEQDWGPDGPQVVLTGRKYLVSARTVMMPGDAGPTVVPATAEREGTGYNFPQPGTINRIQNLGRATSNTGATIAAGNILQLGENVGEVVSPDQLLQYIKITSGANVGQARRILAYQLGTPIRLVLDSDWLLKGTGTLTVGEPVLQATSGARGTVLAKSADRLMLTAVSGTFDAMNTVTGQVSGGAYTPTGVEISGPLVAGAADWQILDWVEDFGVTVTNPLSPTGGRIATLDELGAERNIRRSTGEPDGRYRQRVGTPLDTVVPNAIRRAANHILEPYGLSCCYRQVGGNLLRGFYCDRDACDVDYIAYPAHRYRVLMSELNFRGYFLLGLPALPMTKFGLYCDGENSDPHHRINACDLTQNDKNAMLDGGASAKPPIYLEIYNDVLKKVSGGVGFDLYIERVGCF